MPETKRQSGKSATVDLHDFDADEVKALVSAGMLYLPASPHGSDAAYLRLYSAAASKPAVISKLPRESLQAFADAIRPHVAELAGTAPALPAAFAKVEARLASKPGKSAAPQLWRERSRAVADMRTKLRDMFGDEPTDREIESALKLREGAVRRWRNVHPELFPLPDR